jgi:hypothetical protein
MKKLLLLLTLLTIIMLAALKFYPESAHAQMARPEPAPKNKDFGGFESQVQWGEHLVTIGGCGDCHTPKKMTDRGPVEDSALLLSGHPAQMPPPDVNRQEVQAKGLGVTQTLTAWVGPWGISFAANLTPDEAGIGNWTEQQFIYSLRNGKFKGIPNSRPILPPMPWQSIGKMTDDELKAVFSYLKSIKPIKNVVPQAQPPAGA